MRNGRKPNSRTVDKALWRLVDAVRDQTKVTLHNRATRSTQLKKQGEVRKAMEEVRDVIGRIRRA